MRKPLDQATYELKEAFIFPQYTTRDQYTRLNGREPAPFDLTRRVKFWEDPKALSQGLQEGETITYHVAVSITGKPFFEKDGKTPRMGTVSLSPEQAATVNIPDPGTTTPAGGLNAYEVPMPIALLDEEKLEFGKGLGATVLQIRRVNWPEGPPAGGILPGSFTESDRATLYKIAAKVGL